MKAKIKAYRKGIWAEYLAAAYLMACGYRLLKLRYKTKAGEIDLIARKGKSLVFIEVKARALKEDGLYAVSPKTQGRIIRAARTYVQKHPGCAALDLRFDVIVLYSFCKIHHIRNAFYERCF